MDSYLKSIKNKVINYFNSVQAKHSVLERVICRMEEMKSEVYDSKRYLELEFFVESQIDEFPLTMKTIFLMRSDQLSIRQIA